MRKEEILAKSRKEKNDEGMVMAENQGRKTGITAFCAVFIFVIVFNWFQGRSSYGPSAMFWAFAAMEAYPKYRFTGNKSFLITTICGVIISICSLIAFIITGLR